MWGHESYPPLCSQCPYHVRTGSDAPVSYSEFCSAFGFPAGPSGASELLAFYELRGPDGALLQTGRASSCLQLGLHPETLLFGPDGYLQATLEAGEKEEVSFILLYSNYTPCEELPSLCASTISNFLHLHPEVRLDLLFSQLYHTDDTWPTATQNRVGLRQLAALWPRLTLSPISGGAWTHLMQAFVSDASRSVPPPDPMPGRVAADRLNAARISAITGVGPAFLDLPLQRLSDSDSAHTMPTGRSLTLVPPPHHPHPLYAEPILAWPAHQHKPLPLRTNRPVNVVRHVRLPSPGSNWPDYPSSSSQFSTSSVLLPPGRPVEIVTVTEKEIPSKSQSEERSSQKRRRAPL